MNFNQLKLLLQNHQYKELKSALSEMNEVDIAQFLSELPQDLMVYVFRALDNITLMFPALRPVACSISSSE